MKTMAGTARFYTGKSLPLLEETTPEQRERLYAKFIASVREQALVYQKRFLNETPEEREEKKQKYLEKAGRKGALERAYFSVQNQGEEQVHYRSHKFYTYGSELSDYMTVCEKIILTRHKWKGPFYTDYEDVLRMHLLLTRTAYIFGKLGGGGLEEKYREAILELFNRYCTSGSYNLLRALLDVYPLPVLYSWGEPLAYGAAQQGNMDIIHLLDEKGFDFNRKINSYSMLSVAIINNQIDVLDFLIAKGVEGFSTEEFFRFALYANKDTLNRLIMVFGPDYYAKDKDGFNIVTHILLYSRQFLDNKIDNALYFVNLGIDLQQYFSVTPDLYPPEIRHRWQEKKAIVEELNARGYAQE